MLSCPEINSADLLPPPLPLTPCLGICALGPNTSMSHGSDTSCVPCKIMQWPCRSHVYPAACRATPQLCHSQFTGRPRARSGSRSGISESPAQVLQPRRHPPGPGTRMMGRYLEGTGRCMPRASRDTTRSHETLPNQMEPGRRHGGYMR